MDLRVYWVWGFRVLGLGFRVPFEGHYKGYDKGTARFRVQASGSRS